jgi:hypothetical protein
MTKQKNIFFIDIGYFLTLKTTTQARSQTLHFETIRRRCQTHRARDLDNASENIRRAAVNRPNAAGVEDWSAHEPAA